MRPTSHGPLLRLPRQAYPDWGLSALAGGGLRV